jgi:peptide deformylase
MADILTLTRFGNPILRTKTKNIHPDAIGSSEIQKLIKDMKHTVSEREYGVGLAAPQVGVSVALSVIGIKPTPTRPHLTLFESVIINPEIIELVGESVAEWEGCVSCGEGKNIVYAQVPRYKEIVLEWYDETAILRRERLDGFVAHVIQHEVDHLSGILFVDKVEDPLTYMMADEYMKRVRMVNQESEA